MIVLGDTGVNILVVAFIVKRTSFNSANLGNTITTNVALAKFASICSSNSDSHTLCSFSSDSSGPHYTSLDKVGENVQQAAGV